MKATFLRMLAALSILSLVPGCAHDRNGQANATPPTDDQSIVGRVKTALAYNNPDYKFGDVDVVNSYRGTVQLSGFVNSPEHKEQAAAIARQIEGVKSVDNNIAVK